MGNPMLISVSDDMKLFAYTIQEFSEFAPHDICPTPRRLPIQLVVNPIFNASSLLLVQSPYWLDILSLRIESSAFHRTRFGHSGGRVATELLTRVKSKASQRIICNAISSSEARFAYSDCMKPSPFDLSKVEGGKSAWIVNKKQLPKRLPCAHLMIFSFDSSQLILAGHDRRIYVRFPSCFWYTFNFPQAS